MVGGAAPQKGVVMATRSAPPTHPLSVLAVFGLLSVLAFAVTVGCLLVYDVAGLFGLTP